MVQNIAADQGLTQPTAVLTDTSRDTVQMLRAIYRTGQDLRRRHDWPELIVEATITFVNGTATYAFPLDFERVIFDTHWNEDETDRVLFMGPVEYERYLRGGASTAIGQRFIAIGSGANQLTIYPTPDAGNAGQKVYFLYISNKWTSSAGTAAAAFAADTATSLIDEALVELGAKYLFKRENNLPGWELDRKDYLDAIPVAATAKSSARTLSLCGGRRQRFLSFANIPEGNFG